MHVLVLLGLLKDTDVRISSYPPLPPTFPGGMLDFPSLALVQPPSNTSTNDTITFRSMAALGGLRRPTIFFKVERAHGARRGGLMPCNQGRFIPGHV